MKKIFACICAVAALAACQKNQIISSADGPAIGFENASVDKATKSVDPSTTTETINEFAVWGYMDSRNGVVFENELVSKNGSEWTYTNTQYWMAGHTYYFAAVSPVEDENVNVSPATTGGDYGLGTIEFTNADGATDLIYASAKVEAATGANLSAMPKVGLSFSHLLSKVKFTFTNGFVNENNTLVITGLTMTAPKAGTIDLNVENWWDGNDWVLGAENTTLAFGSVNGGNKLAAGAVADCADERLTIPAGKDQEYTVTFHVALYNGEVLAAEKDLEVVVSGAAFEMGKAYNLTAEINAENMELTPIEFEVAEVKKWYEAGNVVAGQNVETAEELVAAVAKGGKVVLNNDITLNAALVLTGEVELDGNGHTLTSTVSGTSGRAINVSGAKNATIKNLTINAAGERAINIIQKTENVTVKNVTATAANYAVNIASSAPGAKVTVIDSKLNGLCVVSVAAANAVVDVVDSELTCVDNSNVEGYGVITINKDGVDAKVTATRCAITIAGNYPEQSYAAYMIAEGAEVALVDCTGANNVKDANYNIAYGNYNYSFVTFEDALAKVVNGETIMLTKDVNEAIEIPADKNITIDLNGKTITSEATESIKNYGTVTIKNGKITAADSEATRRCLYNYGTMTIEDVEFVQTYAKKGAAINNEGKMTIESATVNSVFYSIWASGANTETIINGGTYTAKNDVNVRDTWAYCVVTLNGAKLTVNGGSFTGNHGVVIAAVTGAKATLNAGEFNCTATYTGNSDWVLFAENGGSVVYDKDNCTLTTANPAGPLYKGANVTVK